MCALVLALQLPVALVHHLWHAAKEKCDFSQDEEISGPPLLTAYLFTFSADGKGTPRPWPHLLLTALYAGALLAAISHYLQDIAVSGIFGDGTSKWAALVFGWLSASTTLWSFIA